LVTAAGADRARGDLLFRPAFVWEPVAVKVLFSATAGSGHLGPLVPFAHACRDAGHEVKMAAPASFAPAVLGAGLDHAPFADVPPEMMGPIFGRLPMLSFEEANATVLTEIFCRLDAQAALPGLTEVISAWQPDVVVREPAEFASLVAAERAGIPQVQVDIGLGSITESFLPRLATPLAELGALAGLAPGQALRTVSTTVRFTSVPAAVETPAGDDGSTSSDQVWRFRDTSLTTGLGKLPDPWGEPENPLVYVTFGSVTAGLAPFAALYADTLEALADLPVRVLMTTGDTDDRLSLNPVPANAHVERWWPQAEVMPLAAASVGHGGFGTTMMALAAGVPQVVIPLFASDQALNAGRVAAIGAGIHLSGEPASVAEIPAALRRVLTDPDFATGAQRVAADMAALADMTEAVPILEELAGARTG
jgi:UDP:flavonoid glycosyltransferase YjiC (YdhE family)